MFKVSPLSLSLSLLVSDSSLAARNVSRVLLLTYPRSGSTFVASLLSLSETALNVYEPLQIFRNEMDKIWFTPANNDRTNQARSMMKGLFSCETVSKQASKRRSRVEWETKKMD